MRDFYEKPRLLYPFQKLNGIEKYKKETLTKDNKYIEDKCFALFYAELQKIKFLLK